jgi:hypothetical protein
MVAWVLVKNGTEDLVYAVRGKESPRHQRRMERMKSGRPTPGERLAEAAGARVAGWMDPAYHRPPKEAKPKGPLRTWASDYWADTLADATEKRRKRRREKREGEGGAAAAEGATPSDVPIEIPGAPGGVDPAGPDGGPGASGAGATGPKVSRPEAGPPTGSGRKGSRPEAGPPTGSGAKVSDEELAANDWRELGRRGSPPPGWSWIAEVKARREEARGGAAGPVSSGPGAAGPDVWSPAVSGPDSSGPSTSDEERRRREENEFFWQVALGRDGVPPVGWTPEKEAEWFPPAEGAEPVTAASAGAQQPAESKDSVAAGADPGNEEPIDAEIVEPVNDAGPQEEPRDGQPAVTVTPSGSTGGSSVSGMVNADGLDPAGSIAFTTEVERAGLDLASTVENSVTNLVGRGVSGEPIEHLEQIQVAATELAGASASARRHFTNHLQIQEVVHSDDTVGGATYLGLRG